MSLDLRLVAYAPNGASQGPLPTPSDVAAGWLLGDVASLAFDYGRAAPRAHLLGQPVEIAVEVSADGSTWSEPAGGRYLYLRDSGDDVVRPGITKAECPSYLWRLTKAIVGDATLNGDGKRPFLSVTPGNVIAVLAAEAKARGRLVGVDVSTFSSATDSNGVPWPHVLSLYYEPTLTLLAVLQNLVDQDVVEVETVGRSLRLYVPGTLDGDAVGPDGKVTLHRGRDLTEAPFRRTWEGLADSVLLVGDVGVREWRNNPSALKPWGSWETGISQGGVSDPGTMALLSDAELQRGQDVRTEFTNGLALAKTTSLPLVHYRPGQWIYRTTDGGSPERLRLRGVTLTRDGQGVVGGNVTLNDRFVEAEVRRARRVQGIVGGATSDAGTGVRPAPPVPVDTQPPGKVGALLLDSEAYQDRLSGDYALITAAWPEVTQNADLTPTEDVAAYEVETRTAPSTGWVGHPPTADLSTRMSPFPVQTWVAVRVRAVDSTGNRGEWSDIVEVLTDEDSVPPPAPSTPLATPYLGQVYITWDGKTDTGGDPPGDQVGVEVHVGATAAFTPDETTLVDTLYGPGVSIFTDGSYGVPVYARLVAVDRSGNRSPVSAASSSAAPARVSGLDIEQLTIDTSNLADDAVEAGKIAAEAVGTIQIALGAVITNRLDDFAVTNAKVANLAVSTAKIQDLAVAEAKIGNLAVVTAKIADLAVAEAKIGALAVTSAKIADLAVLRAKIADLAVDDAKIANLAVGKLTAGRLNAEWVEVGTRLTTRTGGAQSGNRVEFDVNGIRAYSDTAQTLDVNANGSITMAGTLRTAVSGIRWEVGPYFSEARIRGFINNVDQPGEVRLLTYDGSGQVAYAGSGSSAYGRQGMELRSPAPSGVLALATIVLGAANGVDGSAENHSTMFLNADRQIVKTFEGLEFRQVWVNDGGSGPVINRHTDIDLFTNLASTAQRFVFGSPVPEGGFHSQPTAVVMAKALMGHDGPSVAFGGFPMFLYTGNAGLNGIEFQVRAGAYDSTTYGNVRAAGYAVHSARETKRSIRDSGLRGKALGKVKATRSRRFLMGWQPTPEDYAAATPEEAALLKAVDMPETLGFVADEVPAEAALFDHDGTTQNGYSLPAMLALAWEGLADAAEALEAEQARGAALDARLVALEAVVAELAPGLRRT